MTVEEEVKNIDEKDVKDEAPVKKSKRRRKDKEKLKASKTPNEEKNIDEVELGLISDLIKELDDSTDLFLRLSKNNYLKQYREEAEYLNLGYEVKPYIDKNEFLKKMNKK